MKQTCNRLERNKSSVAHSPSCVKAAQVASRENQVFEEDEAAIAADAVSFCQIPRIIQIQIQMG
jgi:hypothetical protein